MRFTAHTLRSLVPALAIAALAALASNSASAQSRLTVPFSFVAGGQNCSAGTYIVDSNRWGSAVVLQGTGHSFTWLTGPGEPAPNDSRVLLTFDHVGPSYVLRTVQYRSAITNQLDKKFREHITSAQQVAMLTQVTLLAGQE